MAPKHSRYKLAMLLVAWLAYLSDVTVEYLVPLVAPGVILEPNASITDSYGSTKGKVILQPNYVVAKIIWASLEVYQALWLSYMAINVCRRTQQQRNFVYDIEGVLPVPMLLFFTAGMLARNMAVIASNRLHYMTSLSAASMVPVLFWASSWYTLNLLKYSELCNGGFLVDVILIPLLLQNGVCAIATWSTLYLDTQICFALFSWTSLSSSTVGIMTVFAISAEMVAWCVLDWILCRHKFEFMITPYIFQIVGIIAITDFKPMDLVGSIPSILLGLVIVITMVRLLKLFWDIQKHGKRTKQRTTLARHATLPLPDLIPLTTL